MRDIESLFTYHFFNNTITLIFRFNSQLCYIDINTFSFSLVTYKKLSDQQ